MNRITFITISMIVAYSLDAKSGEEHSDKLNQHMIDVIAKQLQRCQVIAVCDFKRPGGFVVTRVIRGDTIKVGQFWNGTSLPIWDLDKIPESAVLMYEYSGDNLGNTTGALLETSYFYLDKSKQFLTLSSLSTADANRERILIPLSKIEELLKQK